MSFLIFLFLFFMLIKLTSKPSKIPAIIERAKVCPPHKWRYHEVKDLNGNTVMWKLACDLCGPLKSQNDQPRQE